MATGTMVVARDFYLSPEDLASVHLFDKVRWPTTLHAGELILGVGFLAALGVYAGLAARAARDRRRCRRDRPARGQAAPKRGPARSR